MNMTEQEPLTFKGTEDPCQEKKGENHRLILINVTIIILGPFSFPSRLPTFVHLFVPRGKLLQALL